MKRRRKYLQTRNIGELPIDDNMTILSVHEVHVCHRDSTSQVNVKIKTDIKRKHVFGAEMWCFDDLRDAPDEIEVIPLEGLSSEEIQKLYDEKCPLHKNKILTCVPTYTEYSVMVEDSRPRDVLINSVWNIRKYEDIDGYVISPDRYRTFGDTNPNEINGTFASSMFVELPDIEEFSDTNLMYGVKKNNKTLVVVGDNSTVLNSSVIESLINSGYITSYDDAQRVGLSMGMYYIPYDVRRNELIKMVRKDDSDKLHIVLSNGDLWNQGRILSLFNDTEAGSALYYDYGDNKVDSDNHIAWDKGIKAISNLLSHKLKDDENVKIKHYVRGTDGDSFNLLDI